MGMSPSQLDHLDEIAQQVSTGNYDGVGVLSTGERLYVALAANSANLLARADYTITQAIARLGWDDTAELVARWQYRE